MQLIHPSPDQIWARIVASNSSMEFAWKRDLYDGELEADTESKVPPELPTIFNPVADSEKPAPPRDLELLLGSPRLRENNLLTSLSDKQLGLRLNRLALNAKTSITEAAQRRAPATFTHPNLCPVYDLGDIDGRWRLRHVLSGMVMFRLSSHQPAFRR